MPGQDVATFPIVAIGASAGGLEALERFFHHMPADSGLGLVLIPHLDAHHKSAMVELLQRHTRMPVVEITDGMEVQPNRVHVIPPNVTLTATGVQLRAATPRVRPLTIDTFFTSLAESQGENAIGIVLSGAGSDGALGLKAIKEQGGLTMAQASESSRYDSMPRSAVATGLVDFVLPVEEMPRQLAAYASHLQRLRSDGGAEALRRDGQRHLVKIYTLLRAKTGHDFSRYKENTLIRRVHRRMQVTQMTSISAYVDLLRREEREVEALFRDLLIGVTQFFRDPKAFNCLETQVLPRLFQDKGPDDQVRVWVPGCATGEEVYSIAILLREHMLRLHGPPKVQIFATDIDDQALATARAGLYPDTMAQDVSPDRLSRFFAREAEGYRVAKEIRDMCIFSAHNVIADAPFSKLDLISCRNLLIYFSSSLQNRVLRLFHFALQQRGYLFLGPSENVTQIPKLFTRIDNKYRLFMAQPTETERPALELALVPGFPRGRFEPGRVLPAGPTARELVTRRAQRIIESYSPASVVVDDSFDVLHFSGRTGRYLQPSPGAASLNLFAIVEPSLRPGLRAAIHQAFSTGSRVVHENVVMPADGIDQQLVNIVAEPLSATEEGRRICVVIFQEAGQLKTEQNVVRSATDDQKERTIRHLDAELIATRERLQTTIEELETSNEEMKSANEEFQSVNEELQSANEELETSKEELQSVNEELETVNAELNSKVESLDRAVSDRKNLLESTQIPAVFLDGELRVRSFTPAISDIFHLIESDYGRRITDIVSRLDYHDLPRDVARVQRTLASHEQEVPLTDGSASYIMRILPYRTIDNVIDGAVVTFIDITERKRTEESLARYAAIVAHSHNPIIGMDPSGRITTWNAGAERTYGYAAEIVGQSLSIIIPAHSPHDLRHILARVRRHGAVQPIETERLTKDGNRIFVSSTISPIKDRRGRIIGVAAIERDITERKRAEDQQKLLLDELNHRVKNTLATVLSIAARTQQASSSPEDFATSFEGRIRSLAAGHDLLAQNLWTGADLKALIAKELEAYEGESGSGSVACDDIFVSPAAALVLGMVAHELATNAAKYGALSVPAGRVRVTCRIDWTAAKPTLTIRWVERGGPRVAKPMREGFGLKFIERSVAYELGGEARIDFRPGGIVCTIVLPFADAAATSLPDGKRRRRKSR